MSSRARPPSPKLRSGLPVKAEKMSIFKRDDRPRNVLRRKPSSANPRAAFVKDARGEQTTLEYSNSSTSSFGFRDPFQNTVLNIVPPTGPSFRSRAGSDTLPSGMPQKFVPDLPPPNPLYSQHGSSPSTRETVSPGPFSRTSTPTSMSSYSPGVPQKMPTRYASPVQRARAGSLTEERLTKSNPATRSTKRRPPSPPPRKSSSKSLRQPEMPKLTKPPPQPPKLKAPEKVSTKSRPKTPDAHAYGLAMQRPRAPSPVKSPEKKPQVAGTERKKSKDDSEKKHKAKQEALSDTEKERSRFGFFRKAKPDVKRGPAAGTGHEGYKSVRTGSASSLRPRQNSNASESEQESRPSIDSAYTSAHSKLSSAASSPDLGSNTIASRRSQQMPQLKLNQLEVPPPLLSPLSTVLSSGQTTPMEKKSAGQRIRNFFQRSAVTSPKAPEEPAPRLSIQAVPHYALLDRRDYFVDDILDDAEHSIKHDPRTESVLLPDPPRMPNGLVQSRPASPTVRLRKNSEDGRDTIRKNSEDSRKGSVDREGGKESVEFERAPGQALSEPIPPVEPAPPAVPRPKKSRLMQVGRIPAVVSSKTGAQPETDEEHPRREPIRNPAPVQQSGPEDIELHDPFPQARREPTRVPPPIKLGSPLALNELILGNRDYFSRRTGQFSPDAIVLSPMDISPRDSSMEFMIPMGISPRASGMQFLSFPKSGHTSSTASTTAVPPIRGSALGEDEVWVEYDDLIDDVLSPRAESPIENSEQHGRPTLRRKSALIPRETTEIESPVVGTKFVLPQARKNESLNFHRSQHSLKSPGVKSLRSQSSRHRSQHSLQSPGSFTSIYAYYDGRQSEVSEPPIDKDRLSATTNLRFGALMTSRWLSFGRVLFSPAHAEMQSGGRILVIDGLGNDDWSFYCALTYPQAEVYNLSAMKSTAKSGYNPPENHKQIHHFLENPFPFPTGFFRVVVLRFPVITSDNALKFIVNECNRMLRPGGYLETSVLDLDPSHMGPQTRRAIRGLKTDLRTMDVSLKPLSDNLQWLVGRRFENLARCVVGVPVAGKLADSRPGSMSSDDISEILRDSSRAGDEGITKMVARVGRWWYNRCYESEFESSIWEDKNLLKECEHEKSSFRLLIAHAQKPYGRVRRSHSVDSRAAW